MIQLIIILTVVSLLGVWSFLGAGVLQKSFLSICYLSFFTLIIMFAEKFTSHGVQIVSTTTPSSEMPVQAGSIFTGVRNFSIISLIAASIVLACTGLLAIWEVLPHDTMFKTLSSLAIIAFSSFLIVLVCLQREKKNMPVPGSGESIWLFFIAMWVISFFWGTH